MVLFGVLLLRGSVGYKRVTIVLWVFAGVLSIVCAEQPCFFKHDSVLWISLWISCGFVVGFAVVGSGV